MTGRKIPSSQTCVSRLGLGLALQCELLYITGDDTQMLDSGCPTIVGLEAPQWLNPLQLKQRGLVANHDELD